MADPVDKVEFDATIDECVDVQIRLANHATTVGKRRRRSRVLFGLTIAVLFPASFFFEARHVTMLIAVVVGIVGLGLGTLSGYWYGIYIDWHIRYNTRRMITEMLRGVSTVRCEIELRPDALWTKARETEVSFAWSRLTSVDDADHGIELWFDPGLVLIRSRAFASTDARRRFLERVKELAPKSLSGVAVAQDVGMISK
jgi:hypothetical protein